MTKQEAPLRPHVHVAGRIWKRRFHSENASNVFRTNHTGRIWKRKNHRLFWIWAGSHIIMERSSFSQCFPSTRKRKAGVAKLFQFEDRSEKHRFCSGLVWTVAQTDAVLFERLLRCVLARNRPSSAIIVTKRTCFLASLRSKSTGILYKLHLNMT